MYEYESERTPFDQSELPYTYNHPFSSEDHQKPPRISSTDYYAQNEAANETRVWTFSMILSILTGGRYGQ